MGKKRGKYFQYNKSGFKQIPYGPRPRKRKREVYSEPV